MCYFFSAQFHLTRMGYRVHLTAQGIQGYLGTSYEFLFLEGKNRKQSLRTQLIRYKPALPSRESRSVITRKISSDEKTSQARLLASCILPTAAPKYRSMDI